MIRRRLLSLLLASALVLALCGSAGAYQSDLVEERAEEGVEASAALLADMETDTILFQQDAHETIYPASTTKIMTALLVMEALDSGALTMDQMITADDSVWTAMTSDSSSQAIWPGEELSVQDLLYCLLLPSANDAANVLAAAVGGTVERFVDLMNEKAAELGCTGTHFTNVHGMPDTDHYTTAYDMYLIAKAAMAYDTFRTIVSTETYRVEPTNMTEYARNLTNTNALIREDAYDGKYYYENCIGIKTGTTDAAGNCLVSAAEQDGRILICVMMGCHTEQEEDGSSNRMQFSQSVDLFQWGFDNFSNHSILSTGETVTELPVYLSEDGDETVSVPVVAEESVELYLPNDVTLDDMDLKYDLPQSLTAPVSAGDQVGTVTLVLDGTDYTTVNLSVRDSVVLLEQPEEENTEREESGILSILSREWLLKMIIVILIVAIILVILVLVRMSGGNNNTKPEKPRRDSGRKDDPGVPPSSGGSRSSGSRNGPSGGSRSGPSGGFRSGSNSGSYQGRRVNR